MTAPVPEAHATPAPARLNPADGTPAKEASGHRLVCGCHHRDVRLHRLLHRGRALFNNVFFPAQDPLSGTLLSFATLGVGFAVRPLGGIIGDYLGDWTGRKPVLVGPCCSWGSPPMIGVLPAYQQIGCLGRGAERRLRAVQGLAFGAEWGGQSS